MMMKENKEQFCKNKNYTQINYTEVRITKCPKCGKKHFIKYGFFNGIQRYKCKECNHTFSKVTNTLRMYSKKDIGLWNDFIQMIFEQKSLRECSARLKISLDTAFAWRHKVLYLLGKINTIRKLRGNVHMEAVTVGVNNKGNYKINRPNYINGVNRQFRFLNADKIEIVGVKSSENQMILVPNKIIKARFSKRTLENEEHYKKEVGCKITNKTYIKSYNSNKIRGIAIKHNNKLPDLIKKQYGYEDEHYKQKIGIFRPIKDSLDSDKIIEKLRISIYKYLKCYRGISTKYLQQYFNLMVYTMTKNKISSEYNRKNSSNYIYDTYKSLNKNYGFIRKNGIINMDIFESRLIYKD